MEYFTQNSILMWGFPCSCRLSFLNSQMILGTAATAGMKPAKKTRVRVDVKQIGSCILYLCLYMKTIRAKQVKVHSALFLYNVINME